MKINIKSAHPELVEGCSWFDRLTMSGLQRLTVYGCLFVVIASVSEAIPVYAAPDVPAIEQTYQTIGTLKADFVQTTPVMLTGETQTRPGRLFYKEGGKLRIEYAGDRMMHYIVSENTLYMVDPVLKEIKIYQIKESGLPEEALNFLANLGHLSDYFDVTYDKKDRLVLKSKTKASYKALYCRFNKDNLLESLGIVNKSGNNTDYRFFNIQTGIDLSDKLFKP